MRERVREREEHSRNSGERKIDGAKIRISVFIIDERIATWFIVVVAVSVNVAFLSDYIREYQRGTFSENKRILSRDSPADRPRDFVLVLPWALQP